MQLQTLIDEPRIYIGYDEQNQWLYADWKGEHTQDSSQECCLLLLDSLRARPCAKVLNDNSSITRTTVELTEWGAWWLQEMRRAGLQYVAWVFPRDFAARQATEKVLGYITQPTVGAFDDVASAYVWLQQQPVRPI
ncbi:hypothetical protein [Hymenobacter cellulosilyticus]|uniref:STAS/SEC14 domain-containing protein n=1 Tax=Hymenobacter cellulosilyticus TaxID=2932248 RepID=A0A8T9QDC1_9BACT|nr:hypothetical protein [Hymenobacter cellulosilyticus]UOQ73569.1 hypothetical protein MUN79_06465 [Hymenobacter cellulosilyticus]